MAMVRCKECGQEISSSAKACPHCGKPRATNVPPLIVLVILFIVVAGVYNLLKPENSQSPTQEIGNNTYENVIPHKIVTTNTIPGGVNQAILISPEYRNTEDMTALGEQFHREYSQYKSVVLSVYDDQAAIEARTQVLNETSNQATNDLYDKHMVGIYNKMGDGPIWGIYLDGVNNPATKQIKY